MKAVAAIRCFCVTGIGVVVLLGTACATVRPTDVQNASGRRTTYEDVRSPGALRGVGIESQDVETAADTMVRKILADPNLLNRETPPRVVVDSKYFRNEGSKPINKHLLTDRIRVQLNRAAQGRLLFLGRNYADMVEDERQLERSGTVTSGTQGATQAALGYDYRLGGRIATLDQVDAESGVRSVYYQITFELVSRGSGIIAWSGQYVFKKTAQDDIIYR